MIAQGQAAVENGDGDGLRRSVRSLWQLQPKDIAEAARERVVRSGRLTRNRCVHAAQYGHATCRDVALVRPVSGQFRPIWALASPQCPNHAKEANKRWKRVNRQGNRNEVAALDSRETRWRAAHRAADDRRATHRKRKAGRSLEEGRRSARGPARRPGQLVEVSPIALSR